MTKAKITHCPHDTVKRRNPHTGQVGELQTNGRVMLSSGWYCQGTYEEVKEEESAFPTAHAMAAYKKRIYEEAKRAKVRFNWCDTGFRQVMSNLNINVDDYDPKPRKWTIEVEGSSDVDVGTTLAVGSMLNIRGTAVQVTQVSEHSWDDIRQELAATADGG